MGVLGLQGRGLANVCYASVLDEEGAVQDDFARRVHGDDCCVGVQHFDYFCAVGFDQIRWIVMWVMWSNLLALSHLSVCWRLRKSVKIAKTLIEKFRVWGNAPNFCDTRLHTPSPEVAVGQASRLETDSDIGRIRVPEAFRQL